MYVTLNELMGNFGRSRPGSLIVVLGLLMALVVSSSSGVTGSPAQPLPDDVPGAPGYAPAEPYKAGELLVGFEAGVTSAARESLLEQVDGRFLETLAAGDVELWQVPAGQEATLAERLSSDPAVAFAEPNYVYTIFDTIPNDPEYSRQWGHTRMNSAAGWDLTTGSNSVTIAILDTGIDLGHPDLAPKLVPGYDFDQGDPTPQDQHGHGTHVAGIAAAVSNNSYGVAGVSWGALIMPVRVLGADGSGFTSSIINGIFFAYSNGAKVINLSLGGPSYSQAMQNMVNAAHANGSLVVAAMGNSRTQGNPTQYPAAYSNVMAVAATSQGDFYSFYSQYGPHNDISAPGGEMVFYQDPTGIYSTMPTYPVAMTTPPLYYLPNFDYVMGTSQATPQVSGLASLIWSLSPGLTPDQVQAGIETTATDLGAPGWDSTYGHGRIDVYNALLQYSVPAAPALLPIANGDGDGNYLVDWNSVALATSYTLQEDDNSGFSSPTTAYSGGNTQFQVTNSGPGMHFYRVRATGPAGDSPWSNIELATVVPNAPALLAIANGGNEDAYTVSWNAAAGANGYVLEEDDNASFSSPRTRYVGAALSYDVTGQGEGTWYYRVSGYNAAGGGEWSNTQSTVVDPAVLGAPTLNAISNGDEDGNYTVSWTSVPGATGYVLEQSSNPYFVAPEVIYSGANTSYVVSDQTTGAWYYRVRATSAGGNGPWSNEEVSIVKGYFYLPAMLK